MGKRIVVRPYVAPCGELLLGSYGDDMCLCDWLASSRHVRNLEKLRSALGGDIEEGDSEVLRLAAGQLDEYFAGRRRSFSLPYIVVGTRFQAMVWAELDTIAYGQTRSYAGVALALGSPGGARAVAQAVGANRLSIIVPCHRVVGKDQALTGYAGGIAAKKTLLLLEESSAFVAKMA